MTKFKIYIPFFLLFFSCADQKLLLKKSKIPYVIKTREYSEVLKDSFTNYCFTFYYKDETVIKRFESPSLDKEILDFNIKNNSSE